MTALPEPRLPRVVLRPVRGHHAFEACVEQLATAIRLGVYPRGATLPAERDLALRLRVSRATLREAMAALRAAGLVETTRGRGGGTVVTLKPTSPSGRRAVRTSEEQRREWLDALDFRRVVEPGAAHLAATRCLEETASHADLRELEDAHTRVAEASRPGEHRQADSRFHLTLATLTGSPSLIEAVTALQATCHQMLLTIPVLEANIAHSDRQHASLVRAVLDGRPETARRVMEEHCDDTAALLRGLLT